MKRFEANKQDIQELYNQGQMILQSLTIRNMEI